MFNGNIEFIKDYINSRLIGLALMLVICLIKSGSYCQQIRDNNTFNFEFGTILPNDNSPYHWYKKDNQYGGINGKVKIDSIDKNHGKISLSIVANEKKPSESYECVEYFLPAKFQGKEIELKASLKFDSVKKPILLYIKFENENGVFKTESTYDANLHLTKEWDTYSVKTSLPEKAAKILIGVSLQGQGKIWTNDFRVFIDGKDIHEAKRKSDYSNDVYEDNEFDNGSKTDLISLSDSKIDDLVLLGEIWGFLKYYHPAVARHDYNWDYELFRILPKIISCKTKAERNEVLLNWVNKIGEIKKEEISKYDRANVKFYPDLKWIEDTSEIGGKLVKILSKIRHAKRVNENFYVSLGDGAGNPAFNSENSYSNLVYPDAGFRLLSLYRYWNMIQYFYPDKNLFEEDWKHVLKRYISKFNDAKSVLEYRLAALSLICEIQDTHAFIWCQDSILLKHDGLYRSALEIKFIENKAVVFDYYDSLLGAKTGLKKGDVLLSINNKNIDEIIQEKLPYTSASNYPTKLREIARNLLRTQDTVLNIKYSRNDSIKMAKISSYPKPIVDIHKKYQHKDTCFKIITQGNSLIFSPIGYIYPGTIKNSYLRDIMSDIKDTKGLIVDLRCYPSEFIIFTLSKYLMPEETSIVKWSATTLTEPGIFYFTEGQKVGTKNKEFYKGKVVIIINESTQSQAEYTAMALRAAPKTTVIGSTTAGADGNVSTFYLPGGLETAFSGLGVYYPDGTETQRVGIVPDIEIHPTIKGIREGRDELLDKAIEIIQSWK
jgi:C-terminal processing protease CtpA/Prc